ncbi:MAG: TIR domain-containing protein [Chitinophagaceae bacterium]|jgi:hypothetical protein|nr:TIR domain-containing protein [Chitinophagaceae bacterium]
MQFPKDIFISYAHIDDESLVESQKGWISEFHRALEIRLAQLLGRRPIIWRDPALQGNHIFDQQIVDQFAQVAVVISILTPRYVKSEWCIREVNEFYESCQRNIGFSIQNQARIFKVIKTPVKVELHPEKIRNILGYEFYTTDPQTGRPKELAQVFGQQSEKLYWEKLDDLANDLAAFLENLEYPQTGGAINTTDNNGKDSIRIYLAESSYETQTFRDSIRRELQDNGYSITPDRQLPLIAPVLVEEVNSFLHQSQLSIHLVGENYGIVPEGTQKSIIELQNEVAAAASSNGQLERLIWIPEGKEAKEERQQSFVNKLNEGKDGVTGADLLYGSLEEFKSVMMDKIESIKRKQQKEEAPKEVAATVSGSGLVYLICDMQDLPDIQVLEDFLFNNGYEVVLPLFEGEESMIREDHIENLKMCHAAIIYYGNGNEIWLRSKTRDFLKINGYGREKPIGLKAIYLASPSNASKERFRTLEAEVINGLQGVPEEQLKSLLSKI